MKTCPVCQATYPESTAFCARDGSELRSSNSWPPGTIVRGRYRILTKIGAGGMGAVYKAVHTGFDEVRAIKVLNADLTSDPSFHERFKQEAYITRKLSHPNAVRVEDIDESEDGCPFIVMEYIEGRNLLRVIKLEGPLPAGRVISITKQVASALDSAHALGMVHRDVKPENIVLVQTPEGEKAKVLDFGIARVREGEKKPGARAVQLTDGGFVVGTPQYISPEQAQGKRGDDLDGRSDLYSLGVVMYEMLTCQVPFISDEPMELMISHIQRTPRPVRSVRADVYIPEQLANLVMRMLQKKRELRPASAAALIEDLTRIERMLPKDPTTPPIPVAALAGRATVLASAATAPPMMRPGYVANASAPALLSAEEDVPPFYKRPSVILIVVFFVAWVIWYRETHRPQDLVARHLQAGADFDTRAQLPQAEGEYRSAMQIDPDNGPAQSGLGHVLVEEKKWDDAISTLHEALTLQPDDAVAHNNLGVALQTTGDATDAVTEFHEALRLKSDYADAHANLGSALEKQGDLNGSIAEYREVLRLKPDDADAHVHVGLAYYKLGNMESAEPEYREAIRLRPGLALAHYGLGGVLYNRGERDAGIEELRTAYSLSPDDPEIRAAYQRILEK